MISITWDSSEKREDVGWQAVSEEEHPKKKSCESGSPDGGAGRRGETRSATTRGTGEGKNRNNVGRANRSSLHLDYP